MLLREFRPEDLRAIGATLEFEGMSGRTLERRDGSVAMCGGVLPTLWGPELWIEVDPRASWGEKLAIGRAARAFVSELLEEHDVVWTSSNLGQGRWLEWLGFQLHERKYIQERTVLRWKLQRKGEAWDLLQRLSS